MTQYEAAEKFPHKEEKIPSGTENMWFLPPEDPPQFKPEKTRWAILAMFILLSATNSMQWVEYTIISNIVVEYYQIPSTLVSWTSMVYMITYVPLILPGSYILDKTGTHQNKSYYQPKICLLSFIMSWESHAASCLASTNGQTGVTIWRLSEDEREYRRPNARHAKLDA
ncbi:unnamed protein product [Arctia plantaginis]|uniref:Major facilitator superfamily (MFS) profile domain-containing protein n=1 Tax=Arctia plantaginis TaxID=874455 RepID=A0A8S1A4H7_ARCPL|nr:unnamed protein product [Arctia plantaginis]